MALRRSLVCLYASKNSSSIFICKSKINVNVSLYFFSTSAEKEQQPFTVSEFLVKKHHFSPQVALYVASALTQSKNTQKFDSLLTFLKENGFSITDLERIIRYNPRYLNAKLEKTIKPKITVFQDMGFSTDETAEMISRNPWILGTSLRNKIHPSLSILKGLFRTNVEIHKFLTKSPYVLSIDLEKTLLPNIELLKSFGIPMEQIFSQIDLYPRIFLFKPETIRKHINKVDELGVDRSSKTFFYAVQVVSNISKLELKFKAFRDLGFSENDILRVFRTTPMVFTVSEDKIKKIKEVLLETERYHMSCILNFPTSLCYGIETRYMPRLQVLGILEKKKLIKKWPRLGTLVLLSNRKFCEKFVDPFKNELQDEKLMIVSKSRRDCGPPSCSYIWKRWN